jgi:hypothetical protein
MLLPGVALAAAAARSRVLRQPRPALRRLVAVVAHSFLLVAVPQPKGRKLLPQTTTAWNVAKNAPPLFRFSAIAHRAGCSTRRWTTLAVSKAALYSDKRSKTPLFGSLNTLPTRNPFLLKRFDVLKCQNVLKRVPNRPPRGR